jgi:hypothetical protein
MEILPEVVLAVIMAGEQAAALLEPVATFFQVAVVILLAAVLLFVMIIVVGLLIQQRQGMVLLEVVGAVRLLFKITAPEPQCKLLEERAALALPSFISREQQHDL